MIIVNIERANFKEFNERGALKVKRKELIDSSHGSHRFYLRYYEVQPGGMTPYDVHNYEHIIIVTKGEGSILTIQENVPKMEKIKEKDVIFIKANEPHQIINTSNNVLEFLCFRGVDVLYEKEVSDIIKKYFNLSQEQYV